MIAGASEVYRASTLWDRIPPGSTIWLLDRPFRADLDPRRYRWWGGARALGLAHGATAYSLEAWLDEVRPALRAEVQTLTGYALLSSEQSVTFEAEPGLLRVRHAGGIRQRWDVRSPFQVENGDVLEVRGTPRRDVVVIWAPDGLVAWVPRTGEVIR